VRFQRWMGNNNPSKDVSADMTAKILDELRNIQTVSSLRPSDRVILYIGTVLTEKAHTEIESEEVSVVLAALGASVQQQRHVIAAFEWFYGTKHAAYSKLFPLALKTLYEEELVEEDVFLEWSVDYAKNDYTADDSLICIDKLEELKQNAAPFITWLEEADEEGESEEESDEED